MSIQSNVFTLPLELRELIYFHIFMAELLHPNVLLEEDVIQDMMHRSDFEWPMEHGRP